MLRDLPTNAIDVRGDARAVNEASIPALADSIAEIGVINPIRVRASGERWEVIAGVHRLIACRSIGLADIPAIVVEDGDLRAEMAMIDENLCRAELSPSDRARQTARRKAIYEELHPDTKHGHNTKESGQAGHSAFHEATAAATGASERAVRRDAERGAKVIDEVLDMVRGTKLDTGAYLDRIKNLSPNDQVQAAKRDLAIERQRDRTKPPKVADAPVDDQEAVERQVAALTSAWNKASPEARTEFLQRIDAPVMDGRFAA